MKALDMNKICFITCVNDDFLYDEAQFYMEHICVPDGMKVDFIAVRGAESMAAGYQAAMEASEAKYKIYLHQDSFIVNRNCLQEMLDIFVSNPKIGMIGVAGAVKLNRARPVWWENSTKCGKVYSKKSPEEIQLDVYGDFPGRFKDVAVVDGIFMATQYDLPWRKDLFAGWHFYDISQSREFVEHGYRVVVVGQKAPWLVHACGRRSLGKLYYDNMEIFVVYYMCQGEVL